MSTTAVSGLVTLIGIISYSSFITDNLRLLLPIQEGIAAGA